MSFFYLKLMTITYDLKLITYNLFSKVKYLLQQRIPRPADGQPDVVL